jgi:hypothetical protein
VCPDVCPRGATRARLLLQPARQSRQCSRRSDRCHAFAMDEQLGPKLGRTSSVRNHMAPSPAVPVLDRTLRSARHNEAADLGVKGSRVQISPARQAKHLVRAGLKTCETPRFTVIYCFDNRSDNRVTISGDRRDAAQGLTV